jgi:hypothetical protein
MTANKRLQASPRHSLRMPGYPHLLRAFVAPERDRCVPPPTQPWRLSDAASQPMVPLMASG